jgi:hypothetical protein
MNGFYSKLKDSTVGFVADKLVSIGTGFAALVLGGIFFPVADLVFYRYPPLISFLKAYLEYCLVVFIASLIVWYVIWKRPILRSTIPYVVSLLTIGISGLMRSELLPKVVWIEFLLFFTGIIFLCEALIIHVVLLINSLIERFQKPPDCKVKNGSE